MNGAARLRTWKLRLGVTSVLAILATFIVGVQPAMAANVIFTSFNPSSVSYTGNQSVTVSGSNLDLVDTVGVGTPDDTVPITSKSANSLTFTMKATNSAGGNVVIFLNPASGSGNVGAFLQIPVYGALNNVLLSPAPSALASGASRTVSATLRDAGNRTILTPVGSVTFTNASNPSGTLQGTPAFGTGSATVDGIASTSVTGILTGGTNLTATATVDGETVSATQTFPVTTGSATKIALATAESGALTAGQSRTLTATVQDSNGNTVTGSNATITLANIGAPGTVTGVTSVAANEGVALFTVTGQRQGSVTLEATSAGLSASNPDVAFNVVADTVVANVTITGSNSSLVSGDTRVLTATLVDVGGNTVTGATGSVTFANTGGPGTLQGLTASNVAAVGGVATVAVTGGTKGSVTVEATATVSQAGTTSFTSQPDLDFTVDPSSSVDRIVLTGSPADLTAGSFRVLTATLVDAAGNTVNTNRVVTFNNSGGSGVGVVDGTVTLAPISTPANAGVATVTVTGAKAGFTTVQAVTTGATSDNDDTLGFTVIASSTVAGVTITGDNSDLTSGATRVLTATLVDAGGNLVNTSGSVTFSNVASGQGTATGLPSSGVAATNGVATLTVTGFTAGLVTARAQALVSGGSFTTAPDGDLTFRVIPGDAAKLAISGSPLPNGQLTAGQSRVVTAIVQDSAGNTVTGSNATVTLTNSGAGTLTGVNQTGQSWEAQANQGVATFTLTGVKSGDIVLQATSAGLTPATLAPFDVVPGTDIASILLETSGASVTAGNQLVLTATLRDGSGNTVTGANASAVVAFTKSSGTGTVSGLTDVNAVNGVATLTVTGQLRGAITFQAAAGSVSTTASAEVVASTEVFRILVTSSFGSVLKAAQTGTLTATLVDAGGNTVTGANNQVTFTNTPGPGSVTPASAQVPANQGIATITVTGGTVGSTTVTASAASPILSGDNVFNVTAGVPSLANSTITASNSTITADGTSVTTVQVSLFDGAGNKITVNESTVDIFTTRGTLLGDVAYIGNGNYAQTLRSSDVSGTATLSATVDDSFIVGTASVMFVAGPLTTIDLTQSSSGNLVAGSARVITATLKDANGNTILTSTNVTFANVSSPGSVTPMNAVVATSASGVATLTITGNKAGALTLQASATVASSTGTGQTSLTVVNNPTVASVSLAPSPTGDLSSGQQRTFTATLRDAFGNTVTGATGSVTFTNSLTSANANTLTGINASGIATASVSGGVATLTVTGNKVGNVSLVASYFQGTASSPVAFAVVADTAVSSILLSGTTTPNLASGSSRVLTATLLDANGNRIPVTGTNVTFRQSGGGGSVTFTNANASNSGIASSVNGIASMTVTGVAAGVVEIRANQTGVNSPESNGLTFTVDPSSTVGKVILSMSEAGDLTSGQTRILTATLQDAAGNQLTTPGISVTFSNVASPPGSVTFSNAVVASSASGVATTTITGNLMGSVTMQAAAGGFNSAQTSSDQTFSIVANPTISSIVMSASASGGLTSGDTRVLTATLQDLNGNTITSDSSTQITFSNQGGTGTVTGLNSGTTTAIASSGVATITVTGNKVGTINPRATAPNAVFGALTPFSVVADSTIASIILSGSSATLTSGSSRVLTASLLDSNGNTITSNSSTAVSFSQVGGSGSVTFANAASPTSGSATAASGVASMTVTGVLKDSVEIQASVGVTTSNSTNSNVTFTVVPNTVVGRVLLTASSDDSLVSGTTRELTATLQDAAGNQLVISGTPVTFTNSYPTGPGSVTFTNLGATTSTAGVATMTLTGNVAGFVRMTATSQGQSATGSAFEVIGNPTVVSVVITPTPAGDLMSDTLRVLTATLRDLNGNLVTGTPTVTFGSSPTNALTLSNIAVQASSGVALVTVTGNKVATPVTLTAETNAGLSGTTVSGINQFNVIANTAVARVIVDGSALALTSGQARTLTATLYDINGNKLTTSGTSVTFGNSYIGGGSLTFSNAASSSSGVATTSVTGYLKGSVQVQAQADGVASQGTDSLLFQVIPNVAVAANSVMSVVDPTFTSPNRIYANNDDTAIIQLQLRDLNGNDLDSGTGYSVNIFTTLGAFDDTAPSMVSGARFQRVIKSFNFVLGQANLTSTLGVQPVPSTQQLQFIPGPVSKMILGVPSPITSGEASVLSATLQDSQNRVVTVFDGNPNGTVVFSKAGSSGPGTVTFTNSGTAYATSGVAYMTVTGFKSGNLDISATTSSPIVSPAVSATNSSIVVNPNTVVTSIVFSGDTSTLTAGAQRVLTATFLDAQENPVSSSPQVTFTNSPLSGVTLSNASPTADANGQATVTVTGNAVTNAVTIQAAAAGLSGSTVTGATSFAVVSSPVVASVEVTVSASGDLTSGQSRVVTATLRDAQGNLVSGSPSVTFTNNALSALTGANNQVVQAASGVAVITVTGFKAPNNVTITARTFATATGSEASGQTNAFNVVAASTVSSVSLVQSADGSLVSGSPRVLTATLQDLNGNTVLTSANVNFGQSGSGSVTFSNSSPAANQGVAVVTVTGNQASVSPGQVSITASNGGPVSNAVTFAVVGDTDVASVEVSLSETGDLTSGQTRVVTATLKDANGNLVSGTPSVSFTNSQPSALTGANGQVATATNGVASITVTGNKAATGVTITATTYASQDGSAKADTSSPPFRVVAASTVASILLEPSSMTVTAGQGRPLTATLLDLNGNTVLTSANVGFTQGGPGSVTFSNSSPAANQGVAVVTVTGNEASDSGAVTVTATNSGQTATSSVTVEASSNVASVVITASESGDLTSGDSRVLTATLKDAQGNLVSGTPSVSFTNSPLDALTGANNVVVQASAGVASITVTGNKAAAPVTVTATTYAGLSGAAVTGTNSFDVVGDMAVASVVITDSASGPLASGDPRVLTATLRDANGNLVSGSPSVTFSNLPSDALTLSNAFPTVAANSGVAVITVTGNKSTGDDSVTVTAEATGPIGATVTGTNTFPVEAASAVASISMDPVSLSVESGKGRELTATLLDLNGNTVLTGANVAFTQGGSGSVTFSNNNPAANQGVAVVTVTGNLASTPGVVTVTATNSGRTATSTVTVQASSTVASVVITPSETGPLTSGQTRILTATLTDAQGNLVTAGPSVTFTNNGTNALTGANNQVVQANANGLAVITVTGNKSTGGSDVTVTAATGPIGAPVTGTNAFPVIPGTTAFSVDMTMSEYGNLTSGQERTLTATLFDLNGNQLATSGTSVTFTNAPGSPPGSVTFTNAASATQGVSASSSGVATMTITGNKAGGVSLTASTGSATTLAAQGFSVVADTAVASVVVSLSETGDLTAGQSRVVTATLKDAQGNLVSGNPSVSFTNSGSIPNALTGANNEVTTARDGVASITVTGNKVATGVTVTATTYAGENGAEKTGSSSPSFDVVASSDVASVVVSLSELGNLTSGQSRVVTATLRDAQGNLVTAQPSVTFTNSNTSGQSSALTGANTQVVQASASGVASVTVTGNKVASNVKVTATTAATQNGQSVSGDSASFNVVASPNVASISMDPVSFSVESGKGRELTATLLDLNGNTVLTGANVAFTQGGSGSVTFSNNNPAANQGVAVVTVTGNLASTPGVVTVTATNSGRTATSTVTVQASSTVASVVITPSETGPLTSGQTRILTATLTDAQGNLVTAGPSVTFTNNGTNALTGANNQVVQANANGLAVITVTGNKSTDGSNVTVTAATGPSGATVTGTNAFPVVAGSAVASILLDGSTSPLSSGQSRVLTATLQDLNGNTVLTGTNVDFSQALVTTGTVTFTNNGVSPAANGVATMTVTGVKVGVVAITAQAAGRTSNQLNLTVASGTPNRVLLDSAVTALTAGQSRVLTATIQDGNGNTVTGSNASITLTNSAGPGSVTPSTQTAPANQGVREFTVTGNSSGEVTLTASSAGLASSSITFMVASSGAVATITLSGSNADLSSGQTRVLTATLLDAGGNLVTTPGLTVTFTNNGGSGTVTGLNSGTTTAVNSGGTAVITMTGNKVGTVIPMAQAGAVTGVNAAVNFTVVPGPVSTATSLVTAFPTSIPANGDDTSLITVQLRDANGNNLTSGGATVTIATDAGSYVGGVVDRGNGTYTRIIKSSTSIETALITATVGGSSITDTATVSFTAALSSIELSQSASGDLSSGQTRVLTATLKDSGGNVLAGDTGSTVTFSNSGTGTLTGLNSGIRTATTVNGIATITVTGNNVGTVIAQAATGGKTSNTLSGFNVVAGAALAGTSSIAANPTANVNADGVTASTITVTARDANGNPVPGEAVSMAITSGTGTLTSGPWTTNAAGQATASLTSTTTGTVVVTGYLGGGAGPTGGVGPMNGALPSVGTVSVTFTSVTPPPPPPPTPTAPTAPTIGTPIAGDGQVTVNWTAPSSTGGAAITGYRIEQSTDGGVTWSVAVATTGSTATSQVVTGLINGTAYQFRVAAINSVGTGANSAASISVTPSRSVPGAPTNVTAVAGNAEAIVGWVAPSSTGGSAIVGYRIEQQRGSGEWTVAIANTGVTTTNAVITGLTNGESYRFRVAAINASGAGANSEPSNAVTPEAPLGKTILIVGERGTVRGKPGIIVTGESTGFAEGDIFKPWYRFPGQTSYTEGNSNLRVDATGEFRWQRQTGKKFYAYVQAGDGTRSNRVIIPAN